jgi:hypothetical protein
MRPALIPFLCSVWLASAPSSAADPFVASALRSGLQETPKKDVPPPMPPVGSPPGGAPTADPRISALVAGVIPTDTVPAAREAWEKTTRGRLSAQASGPVQRVSAFDLSIEVRHRSAENQTNDSPEALRLRFRSPGFVRITTANKRELVRGLKGDYLLDPERHEVSPLTASRENAQDIRQLDESVGVAQNFIALSDPSSLRIASLKLLPGAPPGLPAKVVERLAAMSIQWVELRTPYFHLITPNGKASPLPSLVRVQIAADAKTGEVELALVDVDSSTVLSAAAVLIELAKYAAIDGFQMPQHVKVYDIDPLSAPRAFRAEVTTELGVVTKSATLRAVLNPEDFSPPQ